MGYRLASVVGVSVLALARSAAGQPSASPPTPAEAPAEPTAPDVAPAPPTPDEDPSSPRSQARAAYQRGVGLVRRAQWGEALAQFEQSAALHPNPTTTFNIGACERALGRYARALLAFERTLAQVAAGETLAPSAVTDATAHVEEMQRLLVRVRMRVQPATATLTIDGRPLERTKVAGRETLVAGVAAPGPGTAVPSASFDVVLDPGAHVFTLSRKGFADAVINRSFTPGHTGELTVQLERLPATLKVTSSEEGALVRVASVDVGPAPVDVLRPAGTYRVVVGKEGFLDYETDVTVRPGEEVDLRAALVVDEPSVLERWWFWAGAAAIIAGGVTVTYFATRAEPEPPPYDGGSTGWVVQPQRF